MYIYIYIYIFKYIYIYIYIYIYLKEAYLNYIMTYILRIFTYQLTDTEPISHRSVIYYQNLFIDVHYMLRHRAQS